MLTPDPCASRRPHHVIAWLLGCDPAVAAKGASAEDIPLAVRPKRDRFAAKIFDREAGEWRGQHGQPDNERQASTPSPTPRAPASSAAENQHHEPSLLHRLVASWLRPQAAVISADPMAKAAAEAAVAGLGEVLGLVPEKARDDPFVTHRPELFEDALRLLTIAEVRRGAGP